MVAKAAFVRDAGSVDSSSRFAALLVPGLALAFAFLGGCNTLRTFGGYNQSTHMWTTPYGLMAEDRVSGRLIPPETAIRLEYRGEVYYFENEFNVEMFLRDPGVYYYHGYEPSYAGGP
jgi:YHS domain-containing protein